MILTQELLDRGKSRNGSWSRKQLKLLCGKKGKPRTGWKNRIVGKNYPDAVIHEFLLLKDAHLPEPAVDDPEYTFRFVTEGL